MKSNRIGQRIRHTKFMFCARCDETTVFLAGTPTDDKRSEIRDCENDCGQQITTPILVWTDPANSEHHFEG